MAKRFSLSEIIGWAVWIGCAVFGAALAFFAWIGSHSRFWADDYCYSALEKKFGLLGGIWEWYMASGNRFSSIGTVGVVDVFGSRAVAFLPGLLLALWVLAWFVFLDQLRQLLCQSIRRRWLVLAALVQVYFVTLLSPDRLQVIYWRMGMLHYSFPLPLLLLQLGWLVWNLRQVGDPQTKPSRLWPWVLLISGVWAFFNAGHSETAAFMQAGIYGVLLLTASLLLRKPQRARAVQLTGISALGAAAAILFMFLSPSNTHRLVGMPSPDNLWLIIPTAFRYVFDFIFYSIRGQLTPYLVFGAMSAAVSFLVLLAKPLRISMRAVWLGLLSVVALTILFIAASFAPSAYANLQYPGNRALMPAAFLLLAGLGASIFLACAALLRLADPIPATWLQTGALVLLLACAVYPLYAVTNLLPEQQRLATWAERWDERDAQIRQAVLDGTPDIQVQQIEVVRTLEDLDPYAYHWINNCAAIYYGARSITAKP
jgi:hypothetical protein